MMAAQSLEETHSELVIEVLGISLRAVDDHPEPPDPGLMAAPDLEKEVHVSDPELGRNAVDFGPEAFVINFDAGEHRSHVAGERLAGVSLLLRKKTKAT